MEGIMPPRRPNVDYGKFDTEAIKTQLASRNLSTKGNRQQLVARLKQEVDKAWDQFNTSTKTTPLFPTQRKKVKKPKKNPEEIAKEQATLAAKRQEKLKRKLEHEKRVEEARERKRLKKAEKAQKQSEQIARQKLEKEQRQLREAFLGFDVRGFEQQVRKKLDPTGKKIASCSYDTVLKRFKVKFNTPADAAKLTKGITMKKPRKLKFDSSVSVSPSPVESRCVMFLYPMSNIHPDCEQAKKWVESVGLADSKDSEILQKWIASAINEFGNFGTIVNIFRERGFMVVNFSDAGGAEKMLKGARAFNGCSFIHLQTGTPTKLDKRTVDANYHPAPKTGKNGTVKPEK